VWSTRGLVLSLYRRIMRTGRHWEQYARSRPERMYPHNYPQIIGSSTAMGRTLAEGQYICNQARELFHQNMHVRDPHTIRSLVEEGEQQLELGLHYGVPYSRLSNIPTGTVESDLQAGIRFAHRPPKYTESSNPFDDEK